MLMVRAPLRVSFGGGGTDLAAYYARFGGFVLSAAITRYCRIMASEPVEWGIRIRSADYRTCAIFRSVGTPPVEEPLALPKAAIERFAGGPHPDPRPHTREGALERGVDLALASDVPPGSGLGSSSAMAVGLARALAAYVGLPLDAAGAAELACWLEIERLGMPIGKQDQYASAFGGLNAIDFTPDAVKVTPLDLRPEVTAALSSRLLLFSTGRTRDSAEILRQQRADTADQPSVIRSLHGIKALARQMREALLAEDLDSFGELLHLGWRQKKCLSRKISSTAIDRWYEAARRAGALGGKIAGAGGGGFLLLYCPPQRQPAVRATLAGLGLRELAFGFDFGGARVLSRAEAGRGRGDRAGPAGFGQVVGADRPRPGRDRRTWTGRAPRELAGQR